MWKLPGDQVDEPHYATVGEGNKSKDKEGGDDAIFCLRMLLEKWTEGQKAVHCAFIDLEKAYDRVP